MKIFKEEKVRKSWAIKLRQTNYGASTVEIIAVDSITGNCICQLLFFNESGRIKSAGRAHDILKEHDYDPEEYNSKWNENGALAVER